VLDLPEMSSLMGIVVSVNWRPLFLLIGAMLLCHNRLVTGIEVCDDYFAATVSVLIFWHQYVLPSAISNSY